MRRALATAAALLLASCYDPGGQCTADAECRSDQVCGGDGLCVPGTRPPVGDPPVAVADPYAFTGSGPFDVAVAQGVLHNDTDAAGATLTAELVAGPAYGQLYLAPDGSFTYSPVANFNGTDGFTYRATNGTLESEVTAVTITVLGPPLAAVDAYTLDGIGPFSVAAPGVLANDSDPNPTLGPLTAELVSDATSGQVTLLADGSFTYVPGPGFAGTDRFTYRAKNSRTRSDAAAVTITVLPPVAAADGYAVAANVTLVEPAATGVLANDSDPGGAALTAAVVGNPAHGSLTLAPDGSFTYAPDAGYAGADAFTYRATNGLLASAVTTVAITVGP